VTDDYDYRAIIAASPWFQGIPGDCLDKLAGAATIKQLPANAFIWTAGQKTNYIYSLLSGRVRINLASEMGQEFALIDWEAGAWMGEQVLGIDAPNMLEVRVLVPSDLLLIPRQAVIEVGDTWPLMYRNLFRANWNNTRGLYDILSGVLFYPLRARVAGRVLLLIQEHGERVEDGIRINIKLSQNDFARLSMGSRQRVNRIFREWDHQGLVVSRDEHLIIRDVRGLEKEMVPFE
jgi:CRP/FNR family transcriptional regulator, cyclic AMP receptor protein